MWMQWEGEGRRVGFGVLPAARHVFSHHQAELPVPGPSGAGCGAGGSVADRQIGVGIKRL